MQSQSESKVSPKQIAEKIREMRKPHAPKDKKSGMSGLLTNTNGA